MKTKPNEFYQCAMAVIGKPCAPKELAAFTETGVVQTLRNLKELNKKGLVGMVLSREDGRKTLYYLKVKQ
jgi:DNA-binding MarR family transcriptional regulator